MTSPSGLSAADEAPTSAVAVLRRALARTPELRQGLVASVLMAAAVAIGKLVVPVLVQQILDRGIDGAGRLRCDLRHCRSERRRRNRAWLPGRAKEHGCHQQECDDLRYSGFHFSLLCQ